MENATQHRVYTTVRVYKRVYRMSHVQMGIREQTSTTVEPRDTDSRHALTTLCEQIRARAVEMVGRLLTGDIDDTWIRDSAAQVHPLLDSHPELVRKVIEKQAFYIERNSYGPRFDNLRFWADMVG